MPLIKYFIAIIPSEPVFSEIEKLKQEVSIKYSNKSALRSPAHITLHRPFEWREEKENLLTETLQQFKFNAEFEISLKNFSGFEPKVLFIDVIENISLNQLQIKLVEHVKLNLNIFNQANDLRCFHAHITIAFRDLKKQLYYVAMKEFSQKTFIASFKCNSFYLLKHNGKRWDLFKQFHFHQI